ncbi:MAG: HAD family hydrolase [Alkalibacterium thalassium]|nr:HAD family hydrolase [Alkalibacterium thalassium]
MAGLVEEEGQKKIYIKGAPDRLLDMADLKAESEERAYWEEQVRHRSRKGERVIAAAVKEVDSSLTDIDHEDVSSGLTLLGLTGIMDPPREEAIEAVRVCKEAGIQVKMITGDHKETALAIAKQMGITDHDDVIEGRELDHMNEEEIKQAVSQSDVFARTSPNNKLQLVKRFKQTATSVR